MARKMTAEVRAAKETVAKEVKAKKSVAKTSAKAQVKTPDKSTTKVAAKKATVKSKAVVKKTEAPAKTAEVKKEAPVRKAATGKSASKVAEKSTAVKHIFEIDGVQINTDEISERIKEAYKAEGHRIGSIKSLDVYYNFSERKAYYVINGKSEDKYIEF